MKNFLFLMIGLFFTISYSQNNTSLTIIESAEFIDVEIAQEIHAVRTGGNNLTGLVRKTRSGSRTGFVFDVFDENLNRLSSNIVDAFTDETYIGDLFYNNQFLIFTVNTPNRKDRVLYCHVFNLEKNTHNRVELFQATVEKNQPIFSGSNKRETNFAFSPNEKYFVIATDNVKRKVNSFTVRVFDSETMKMVYEKSYQEHKKNYFQFNEVSIEDDGTVYTLGKLYKSGKSDKRNGATNYQFILNQIQADKETQTRYIDLTDKYINSLSITPLNNKLHLFGFYSEKRTGQMMGGCNFIINKDNFSIASKELYELPLEVYEGIYGDRKGEKQKNKSTELKNFSIDYVLNDLQGGTYLLAEEFFVRHQPVGFGVGMAYQTTYHYNNVIVFKFNNSGKLEWGRSINKKADKPSYNAFLKYDQLHIILNSGKRLTEKNDGRTKVSKGFLEGTSLYDISISKIGDISYNKIQDNRGNTYYLPFYGSYENNRFIMTSDGKRKKQFMVLK